MTVYKYVDEKGIAIIRDLTVKTSLASELNDPFELTPKVNRSQLTRAKYRRELRRPARVEAQYQDVRRRGLVQNKRTFKREYRQLLPAAIAAQQAMWPDVVENLQLRFVKLFERFWRIFCVSRICNSILMWSHYADKHKGLVVGFDTSHPNLASFSKDAWFDVEYLAEKADFDFDFEWSDLRAFRARLSAVVRRKSPEWAYEREVRLILPAPDDGGTGFTVEPGTISRVILGARAPQPLRDEVCAILSRPHFRHVALDQATLSADRFQLEFVPRKSGHGTR